MIISITIKHSPILPSVPGYTKLIYLEVWSSWSVKWTPVTEEVTLTPKIYIYKWTQVLQKSLPWLNLACKSMHKTSSWHSFSVPYRKELPISDVTWTQPTNLAVTMVMWEKMYCEEIWIVYMWWALSLSYLLWQFLYFNWKILNILKPNIQKIIF